MKEQILAIKCSAEPLFRDRMIYTGDKNIIAYDKNDNKITLADHKKLYPYELDNEVTWHISTTLRDFAITIPAGYVWNGADIPRLLWFFVGSKDNPEFKIPSMIHDFMLEFKSYIYNNVLCKKISIKEYRRLTSLIFRHSLKMNGTKTVKSNIMSGAVQFFQSTFNRKEWKINETDV